MALLTPLSCSTSIGQTAVFGLASFSISSLCHIDDHMCCPCTTKIIENGTVEYSVTTPPIILSTLFPGLFPTVVEDYRNLRSKAESEGSQNNKVLRRSVGKKIIDVRTCQCVNRNILQNSIATLFLMTLPSLVLSCFTPSNPPQDGVIVSIPPLPLPPAPDPIPVAAVLFPAVRGFSIPIAGVSFPDDGCPSDEILVQGVCSPLLESVPSCQPPQWVVLNVSTSPPEGTCGTRLCGRGRVFLVTDQLCHDVREPGLCPGNRRLFVTAFGSPVCDCLEGEFPDEDGTCYSLFSQGPCPEGEIWGPREETEAFACRPQLCPFNGELLDVPFEDGNCYPLGSQGPCRDGELVGFSISKQKAVCTTLEEAGYEILENIAMELDLLYPRFAPPAFTASIPPFISNRLFKRQVGNLMSDPVIPDLILNLAPNPGTILETPLLTQCRPGARRDVNFKCRDVILGPGVDNTAPGVHAPPVPPLQTCPNNQCFNDMTQCVTCEQVLTDTCALSVTLNLQQASCQAIAAGLG